MTANPYQRYKEQSLSTLAPGELLVKLFDEAVKQMRLACIQMEKGDLGAANDAMNKSQTIISTLAGSLDMRYDISGNLRDLYIFMAKQVQEANVKKDPRILEETIPLLKELRDSFDQAEKICRMEQHKQALGGRAI